MTSTAIFDQDYNIKGKILPCGVGPAYNQKTYFIVPSASLGMSCQADPYRSIQAPTLGKIGGFSLLWACIYLLVIWKLAAGEETSCSLWDWFLYVPQPKCVLSSERGSWYEVLVSNWGNGHSLCGFETSWPRAPRETPCALHYDSI